MILNNLVEYLNEKFPSIISEDWDNTGHQISRNDSNISKILIVVDITDKTVDFAVENEIDLIISHHPLLFSPIENIDLTTYKGKLIKIIINNNINCYSIHTNYDSSIFGMNEAIKQLMKLKNCELLRSNSNDNNIGYGIIGELEREYNTNDFIDTIKKRLNLNYLIGYNIDIKNKVKRIAFCGGAGAEFIVDAFKKHADIYITGDIKHHDAQLAYELSLPMFDVTHYGLEKIFISHIGKILTDRFDDLEIFKYEENDFKGTVIN